MEQRDTSVANLATALTSGTGGRTREKSTSPGGVREVCAFQFYCVFVCSQ